MGRFRIQDNSCSSSTGGWHARAGRPPNHWVPESIAEVDYWHIRKSTFGIPKVHFLIHTAAVFQFLPEPWWPDRIFCAQVQAHFPVLYILLIFWGSDASPEPTGWVFSQVACAWSIGRRGLLISSAGCRFSLDCQGFPLVSFSYARVSTLSFSSNYQVLPVLLLTLGYFTVTLPAVLNLVDNVILRAMKSSHVTCRKDILVYIQ